MREYKIVRALDSGGMGMVYEGLLERIDGIVERVAIKIPKKETPDLRQLFVNEARSARHLSHEHPHLVTIQDFGETAKGTLFLVMELIDGASVSDLCVRQPLSGSIIRQTARAMLSALEYLHRNEFVHRDISPRNILLGCDNRIKLIDFGLIKSQNTSDSGRLCGTPGYASPEQLRGERLSPASDLYSLGAVLYKMATAGCPFGKGPSHQLLDQMRIGAPPLPDEMPDDLVRLIQALLAFRQENRVTSQQALAILAEDSGDKASDIGAEVSVRRVEPEVLPEPRPGQTFSDAVAPVLRMGSLPSGDERSGQSRGEHGQRWVPWAMAAMSFVTLLAALVASYALWMLAAERDELAPRESRSVEHAVYTPTSSDSTVTPAADFRDDLCFATIRTPTVPQSARDTSDGQIDMTDTPSSTAIQPGSNDRAIARPATARTRRKTARLHKKREQKRRSLAREPPVVRKIDTFADLLPP